jgi:hypothetical protein
MNFSTALSTLNNELGDGDNFALSAVEKTRALTRAWNDKYVVTEDVDTTNTYVNTTDAYDIPEEMRAVLHVYQEPSTDGFKKELPHDAWHIINTLGDRQIQVHRSYKDLLENNKTLHIHGVVKLTTSDTLDTVELQEYVLQLANYNCVKMLLNKGTFKFLKNDTSVAELVALKRELQQDVEDYRRQAQTHFVQI